jgi:outer membrane biosynthesis protein TonB
MKKLLFLVLLAGCGPKSTTASPTPIIPDEPAAATGPDAGPDQAGELPMAEVQTEMEAVRDEIKANCAATTAFAGVTAVIVTIAPDGTAKAEVESTSGMPEVDQCVLDSISGSQFSPSSRGQRFHYSFKFK